MIEFESFASSSSGNLYGVSDRGSSLLLECGLPIKQIKRHLDFKLSNISGCLLTHCHMDHAKAAEDVLEAGTPLYCSKGTAEALNLSGHNLHIIKALEQFKIGSWTVLPFDTVHDCSSPLGFLIANGSEKLLFAVDSRFIKYRFKGITHLCLELNYSEETFCEGIEPYLKNRIEASHISLKTYKGFIEANDMSSVKEIYLLHLSDSNSDENYFKTEIQKLTGKPVYVAGK